MAEDTITTYPRQAVDDVAGRLMDLDYNLTISEAEQIAFDIVIDTTIAVDKLRAIEKEERPTA